MTTMHLSPWQLFWAKTDRDRKGTDGYDPAWTRPLWAHLLDVGHTALLLWEHVLPDALRHRASEALGLSDEEAGRWLSLWIGLHDLGKAIPSFQCQDPTAPYLARMRERGFTLEGPAERGPHHGHATIGLLVREWLASDEEYAPLSFRESLAAFIGFHHGRLVQRSRWQDMPHAPNDLGGNDWQAQQRLLLHAVHDAWSQRYGHAVPKRYPGGTPSWLLGLAGWATFADWLGSYAKAFPGKGDPNDPATLACPADYLDASRAGAERALREIGVGLDGRIANHGFAHLFPALADFAPRPIQQALLDLELPDDLAEPTLTIVEAPTGEGKTEAALALAARQQSRAERGGGLYLALPTQATANGLLDRATSFLEAALPQGIASFRLAYGRSELHPASAALLADPADLSALYDEDGAHVSVANQSASRVRTLEWFTRRKRALLAPFGLGTIDQALLGVLYARHFFVRLFGLAGKTVIVDEVHAYDVYMNELIRRLLPWLRALGTHVILLSATLPAKTRRELLKAWDAEATTPVRAVLDDKAPVDEALVDEAAHGYPAVWSSWGGQVRARVGKKDGLTANRTQHCRLEQGNDDPKAIADRVEEAVSAGAVVAVVCNTVRRAQDVFEAIRERIGDGLASEDLVLFHARFVHRERQRIETQVLERFGKHQGTQREAGPAVLVGTQVIEQSLDLDVDLMLSDLAPIDLLLQRAGRLHRHDRTDRPAPHDTPTLVWLCPAWEDSNLPDVTALSGGGKVYNRTILWRTALLLRDRSDWQLPQEYRTLIEAVYGEEAIPPTLAEENRRHWKGEARDERQRRKKSKRSAQARIIPKPTSLAEMLLAGQPALADDEDEQAHADLKAFTREGESVEVVVVHADTNGAFFLDPGYALPAPLPLPESRDAKTEAIRAILGASVRLSQRTFIQHFRDRPQTDEIPDTWNAAAEQVASLRGLHPVVMHEGVWGEASRAVRWNDTLGLVID